MDTRGRIGGMTMRQPAVCGPHVQQETAAEASKVAEEEASKVEAQVQLLLKKAERAKMVLAAIEAAEKEVSVSAVALHFTIYAHGSKRKTFPLLPQYWQARVQFQLRHSWSTFCFACG